MNLRFDTSQTSSSSGAKGGDTIEEGGCEERARRLHVPAHLAAHCGLYQSLVSEREETEGDVHLPHDDSMVAAIEVSVPFAVSKRSQGFFSQALRDAVISLPPIATTPPAAAAEAQGLGQGVEEGDDEPSSDRVVPSIAGMLSVRTPLEAVDAVVAATLADFVGAPPSVSAALGDAALAVIIATPPQYLCAAVGVPWPGRRHTGLEHEQEDEDGEVETDDEVTHTDTHLQSGAVKKVVVVDGAGSGESEGNTTSSCGAGAAKKSPPRITLADIQAVFAQVCAQCHAHTQTYQQQQSPSSQQKL